MILLFSHGSCTLKKKLVVICKWISNELAQTSNRLPRTYIVSPALETMDQCIVNLDTVIGKLVSSDKDLPLVPITETMSLVLAKTVSKT